MFCVWEDSSVRRKTQVLIHKTRLYPDIGSDDRIPVSLWQEGKQGLDFWKSGQLAWPWPLQKQQEALLKVEGMD